MPVALTTHTYTITEIATSPNSDGVTIVGSVDGTPVSVGVYQSQMNAASNAQAYVANAMLAAANLPPANQVVQPISVNPGIFIL